MSIRSVLLIFNIRLLEKKISIIFALLKFMKIYGMIFLSLTNVKNSNKDLNWEKQNLIVKKYIAMNESMVKKGRQCVHL
jgi:hypothetical protein